MEIPWDSIARCAGPTAVGGILAALCFSSAGSREYWDQDEPVPNRFWSNLFGGLFACLGIVLFEYWSSGLINKPVEWFSWQAKEPWKWVAWSLPGLLLSLSLARIVLGAPVHFGKFSWPVLVSWSLASFAVCLPQGTGWEDKALNVGPWIWVGTAAIVWNAAAIDSIAANHGARWNLLVVLANLGGATFLAIQIYGSLAEWGVACMSLVGGAAVIAAIRNPEAKQAFGWHLAPIGLAGLVLSSLMVALCDFYASSPISKWVLGVVLFAPTGIGFVDFILCKANSWVRVVIAFALSIMMVVALIYQFYYVQKPAW